VSHSVPLLKKPKLSPSETTRALPADLFFASFRGSVNSWTL